MRNLTVKRARSFVACLGKMKVYIEDMNGETEINGFLCRKLGTLKNGEQKSFSIDEREAKVFVIADGLTKNYCNDFYQLAAGDEDVTLTGKNVFNPASSNAFRFDNNDSAEVMANRRRGENKGGIVFIIAIVIGALIGTVGVNMIKGAMDSKPATYSSEGMSVTLTGEFETFDAEGYTAAYTSGDVAVFALKESFSIAEGLEELTLDDYVDLVLYNNGNENAEVKYLGETPYFEYSYEYEADSYSYTVFMYKASDAFWLVQFVAETENFNEYRSKISDWASSIKFEYE